MRQPRESTHMSFALVIALPWELGHTVALGYSYTEGSVVPSWLWTLTAVTYGWLLFNLILLIIPSRRPVHDRLAHTVVRVQKMVVTP
jgi:bacteriorhodopsin